MRILGTLIALLLLPLPTHAADWFRVETPNLIVFGPGEKRSREVAAEFERFREAVSLILPGATTVSAVPTIIVAFENDAAFNPYRPMFNGKPVRVGGFYTGSDTDDMIAFPYGDRENSQRIIFHEYTHLITANASRGLPAWVSEGLADFYSTFEIRPDGKQALLGHVVPQHIELLNGSTQWLSLEQLLSVTHDSPLYNEGERRSLFYALRYLRYFLDTPVPASALAALDVAAPNRATLAIMDRIFVRALAPTHASCADAFTPAARFAAFVRAHWLRMPAHLLIPHLVHKAFISPARRTPKTA